LKIMLHGRCKGNLKPPYYNLFVQHAQMSE